MPIALLALTAGAFGIGTTEFIIMGLLLQVASDLHVSVAAAGMLVSGYAIGVVVGAPVLTILTRSMPRRAVLVGLMVIFTFGNAACALAPTYGLLMAARVVTALAHGTFFGVGAVVATALVPSARRASAIATMFTGLTAATLLGVPAGAWLGLDYGWRAAFWAVAVIGVIATAVLLVFLPRQDGPRQAVPIRQELRAVVRTPLLLALLITVLGFSGMMTVFTYIQPMLIRVSGFSQASVSLILLVFGLGLAIGNVMGGKLADRGLSATLVGSLTLLALVLAAMRLAMPSPAGAILLVFLLGAASFGTVAPLQLYVLQKAGAAGQGLASSLNIAAFNLGNALGAWLGAVVIGTSFGLPAIPLVAAGVTALGLILALVSLRLGDGAVSPTGLAAGEAR